MFYYYVLCLHYEHYEQVNVFKVLHHWVATQLVSGDCSSAVVHPYAVLIYSSLPFLTQVPGKAVARLYLWPLHCKTGFNNDPKQTDTRQDNFHEDVGKSVAIFY